MMSGYIRFHGVTTRPSTEVVRPASPCRAEPRPTTIAVDRHSAPIEEMRRFGDVRHCERLLRHGGPVFKSVASNGALLEHPLMTVHRDDVCRNEMRHESGRRSATERVSEVGNMR